MDLAGRTLEERRARLCEPRHTLSKEKAWADRIFRQWTNLRCARLWLGFAGASWLLWLGSEFVCLMAADGGRARSGWENDMTDATKPRPERPLLDHYFGLRESGSDVRTEFIAGVTTFLTMVYIVFVNPQILSSAGMDKGAVFVATFTAVLEHKYSWQQALAGVFCSGVIFFLISIFNIREYIINSIPKNLKLAISAGVGLFLGIIALEEA